MKIKRAKYRLRRSLAIRGIAGTARVALARTPGWLRGFASRRRSAGPPKAYEELHPFDRQFGVETSGHLQSEDLESGHRSDLFNAGYFATPPSAFHQIIARLGIDWSRFTFLDLGSGKGRMLLLAAGYPFREIIGVELSPRLHRSACANILHYPLGGRKPESVRSFEGDAAEFPMPSGPLLIYMWNAFEGPVFSRVLRNVEASLEKEPREMYVLYAQPDLEEVLEASPFFDRLWKEDFQISDDDYRAYAFPLPTMPCVAYRARVPAGDTTQAN